MGGWRLEGDGEGECDDSTLASVGSKARSACKVRFVDVGGIGRKGI